MGAKVVNEKHPTREGWLLAAMEELWPMVVKAGCTRNPTTVSVGWPSSRPFAGKTGSRRIGECWSPKGKARTIFISPALENAVAVLDTLAHEMIHAGLAPDVGHKKPFARAAKALGMEGKPTSTYAGDELKAKLEKIAAELGPYPHEKVDREGYRPQSTRMLKVVCPDCGYTLRTTRVWLEVGIPTCCCGAPMTDDPDEQGGDEQLAVAAQHLEYRTKDGRFVIRFSKTGTKLRDGRWTLTDLEHEDGPRVTVAADKQDALDTCTAIREGLFTFPELEDAPPEDQLAELEDDEEWGDGRATELDDYLADDEPELHDYPEDDPVAELPEAAAELRPHERFVRMPATEEEYERMTEMRELSGARKSEQIALSIESALD